MTISQLSGSNFWASDLEDIESVFLSEGQKITELPVTSVSEEVPPQGSVLLEECIDINSSIAEAEAETEAHFGAYQTAINASLQRVSTPSLRDTLTRWIS